MVQCGGGTWDKSPGILDRGGKGGTGGGPQGLGPAQKRTSRETWRAGTTSARRKLQAEEGSSHSPPPAQLLPTPAPPSCPVEKGGCNSDQGFGVCKGFTVLGPGFTIWKWENGAFISLENIHYLENIQIFWVFWKISSCIFKTGVSLN